MQLSAALFTSLLLFTSALAFGERETKPPLWTELGTTLKQVREVIDLPADSPLLAEKTDIATQGIGLLLKQRELFPALMTYVANDGIIESDAIVEDFKVIFDRAAGPSAKVETIVLLKKIEFLQLALEIGANNFAVVPGAEITPEGKVESPMGPGLENVLKSPRVLPNLNGLKTVNEIETAVIEHLGALEAYHASAKRTEKWVYRVHTFLGGIGMAYLASVGMNYIDWRALTGKEVVGSIGGAWAVNRAVYWAIWEKLGLLDTMKQVFSFGLFDKLRDSWVRLIFKAPKLALPYVSSAAQDKPVNPEMQSSTYENAALEALMRVGSFGTEKQLLEIAIRSLENGQIGRANRILNLLSRQRGSSREGRLAARIQVALKAKSSLEWKIFRQQLLQASLRVATFGLGLVAINAGAHYLIPPETFTRWRSIAIAITGVIGASPIMNYLWQHPPKEKIAAAVETQKLKLVDAFKSLMIDDPSGEIVAKIAQYRTSATGQKFVVDAALEALESSPRGAVSKTLMKMLTDELAKSNGPSSRVRAIVETTFRQFRSCHASLQSIVGQALGGKPTP